MAYNLNVAVTDTNGVAVVSEGKEQTVKDFCIMTLLSVESSAKASPEEKLNRAKLANKLMNSKEDVELTVEEVTTLKTVTGEGLLPWAYFQVVKILDPASVK